MTVFVPTKSLTASMIQAIRDQGMSPFEQDIWVCNPNRGSYHVAEFFGERGVVHFVQALLPDARLPIALSINTGVAVYINPQRYGVIWPKLTFTGRAVEDPKWEPGPIAGIDISKIPLDIQASPSAWPDLGLSSRDCLADVGLCTAALRSPDDRHALHASFDPLTPAKQTVPRFKFRFNTNICPKNCFVWDMHNWDLWTRD